MEIYVVQQGDNIVTIAEKFGVTVEKLANENGLIYPYNLAIGQTIVITYPKLTHIVQEGDTLQSISELYVVSLMQILRNNPWLSDREYIYPGETLIISYNTVRSITTNGFSYPYIKLETLVKVLPNLTYLSIFNYTITERGEIREYYDDVEIIRISKEYDTIPLLMITTLTPLGIPNVELAFNVLLNEEYQEQSINQFIKIMKMKGYLGINIVFNYLNENSLSLYLNFVQKISKRIKQEGFLFFVSINYDEQEIDNERSIDQIDYSQLSMYVDGMIFIKLVWGTNFSPPSPVSNINDIRALLGHVTANVSSDKITISKPILGYDWRLPHISNRSSATSMTIVSALRLAYETNSTIQFDEDSQTPYFYYNSVEINVPSQHIVWFIDARSISALNDSVIEYSLNGTGIWNIMIANPQLWTMINSQFDTIKLL